MMTAVTPTLQSLLQGMAAAPPLAVAGLALQDAAVVKGGAYVALQGNRRHGLEFAGRAIAAGASALLWDPAETPPPPQLPPGITGIAVPQLRARLGSIADRYYQSPSAQVSVAGVTGTNGKTTCAWLLAGALSRLHKRCAYVGTLGSGFVDALQATGLTTPDVITLHRQLREFADHGATHVAMEVSSHALAQERVAGVRFHVAAFTNLSRDHLDYHGSMQDYAAAKARLFAMPGLTQAVINVGDPVGEALANTLPDTVGLMAVTVGGVASQAEQCVHVEAIRRTAQGLQLEIVGHFGRRQLQSRLLGEFNAENLAIVLGLLLAWGFDPDDAIAALAHGEAPPGRMESFPLQNGALAIVDYAHTPDALAKALKAARGHAARRLSVVFGCGGDRDAGKRPQMAAVAESLADAVWLTDDNPRSESAAAIVSMVLAGFQQPSRVKVEHDRAAAIAAALAGAGAGDVVVIAGKGHEDTQQVGTEIRAFSDRECVLQLSAGRS